MFKVIHQHDQLDAATFNHALECARESIKQAALTDVPSRLDKDGSEQKCEAFSMARRFCENGKAYFEFITTQRLSSSSRDDSPKRQMVGFYLALQKVVDYALPRFGVYWQSPIATRFRQPPRVVP